MGRGRVYDPISSIFNASLGLLRWFVLSEFGYNSLNNLGDQSSIFNLVKKTIMLSSNMLQENRNQQPTGKTKSKIINLKSIFQATDGLLWRWLKKKTKSSLNLVVFICKSISKINMISHICGWPCYSKAAFCKSPKLKNSKTVNK